MKFDLITRMSIFTESKNDDLKIDINTKQPKPIMLECYPDDWCKPESGTGCCPGPEDCWPTLCTPDR